MDAFLATSFDAIKDMFSKQTPAKYAYVYMAQPLDLYSTILFSMFWDK